MNARVGDRRVIPDEQLGEPTNTDGRGFRIADPTNPLFGGPIPLPNWLYLMAFNILALMADISWALDVTVPPRLPQSADAAIVQSKVEATPEADSVAGAPIAEAMSKKPPIGSPSSRTQERWVDPSNGDDVEGDGRSAAAPYRTINRALRDIPKVVVGRWIINLRTGAYRESVRLGDYSMGDPFSHEDLFHEPEVPKASVTLRGNRGAMQNAAILPPEGEPCIAGSDVNLFLEGLTCKADGNNGIMGTASRLVLDDVRVIADSDAVRRRRGTGEPGLGSGIYVSRSSIYYGGRLEIVGPFTAGISLRDYSMARPGTRLQKHFTGLISGAERGVFLRDHSSFTTTFNPGSWTLKSLSEDAILAQFHSTVFLTEGVILKIRTAKKGLTAQKMSLINIDDASAQNVAKWLAYCDMGSAILVEQADLDSIGTRVERRHGCFAEVKLRSK